ncbi:ataxin-7-like protein 3 isoform X2 [Glandiceps talaboti]
MSSVDGDMSRSGEIQAIAAEVFTELVDDISLGLCFEFHRSCKTGSFFLDDVDPETMKQYEIVDKLGLDVFGQVQLKKTLECVCPNCNRTLSASRFAPHLEKCMGMGRNSSRLANRRLIANSGKADSENEVEDQDDNDWSVTDKKTANMYKKMKKDKMVNSPRRVTKSSSSKSKNGDTGSVHSESGTVTIKPYNGYDSLSMEERKTLLMNTCGVISEHTKKMCTSTLGEGDDVHVDIDSFEDTENSLLRDAFTWEGSSTNASPADSNSTASTSSNVPKRHKKKSKRQTHKKSRSSLAMYDNVE